MRKVLILAYYFPPLGMGGTQRAAKFAKYLPEFGWQPVVMTVKEIAYFAKDWSLLADVANATIIRTGSLDPQRLLWLLGRRSGVSGDSGAAHSRFLRATNRLLHWLFVPDSKLLWLPFLLIRAFSITRHERFDCLFVTSPPHSIHLAGILLKKFCKIPLVVDFRDAWAGGNFQDEPTRCHAWINRHLERWVLKQADRGVAVSSRLTEELSNRSQAEPDKFHTITNGYDEEDLAGMAPAKKNQDRFRIIYCGALSRISPLGSFLAALSDLLAEKPQLRAEIAVEFVGHDLVFDRGDDFSALKLDDIVAFSGYQMHADALRKLKDADLLLYPVADWASQDFIPGKTFEYLASGIPILAIGPRVEGTSILADHSKVIAVDHENIAGIKHAIFKQLSVHRKTGSVRGPLNRHSVFERRRLTKRLATIFNEIV